MADGSVAIDQLAAAFVAFQADLKPVDKSANNPFFKSKYAPLPEVMKAVQPLLAKHSLAVAQFPTHLEGQSALRTILLHESGQSIEDTTPLLLVKDDPQAQGSAMTYARRYGVMAVLGMVADEDDDGNAASHAPNSVSSHTYGAATNRVASQKQLDLITTLAKRKGKDAAWLDEVLPKITTSAGASEVIDKLQELEDA